MLATESSSILRIVIKLDHRFISPLFIVIILLLKFVPHSAVADTVSNNALVDIVDELNELVYRYDLAGGWFSETDNAKLVLTRLAMAHGDFGLPKPFGSREGRYLAVTATIPPKDKKWVYWNKSIQRFQVWRGAAPHLVQIVTAITRTSTQLASKAGVKGLRKRSVQLTK